MAICPFAKWRPLPENRTQPPLRADQCILHTAVDAKGPTSLYGYFAGTGTSLESHFFVKMDGTIEQYIDTARTADANYKANIRAISIETEDEGDPAHIPWSKAQLASLVRLIDWVCDTHPAVLRRRCPGPYAAGIGYHSMWGAPSPWTPVPGKTCPGAARIPQVPGIIAAVVKAAAPPPAPKPAQTPAPSPSTKDEDEMYSLWKFADGNAIYAVAGNTQSKRHVKNVDVLAIDKFLLASNGRPNKVASAPVGSPLYQWLQSIPTVA